MARIAYADPPYPGQSAKHYADHPDYAGEVDHFALCEQLRDYDGWVLHTSSVALGRVLDAVRHAGFSEDQGDFRVMAWTKPFAAFKANVPVAYAWEPVIVKTARKPEVSVRGVSRDWIAVPITMLRGLTGAKPAAVCLWAFGVVGANPDDELVDLFPGTGAVMEAWNAWRQQLVLKQTTT